MTIAAALLGAASLVSRLVGIVRDRLLSGTFGAGAELDAYYAAFRAPDFVYSLFVVGAVSAGFIPVFMARAASGEDGDAADEFAARVISVMGLMLAVLAVIGALCAGTVVPRFTGGFGPEQQDLTVRLTRVMFLSPFFLGLSSVFGALLQSRRRFLVYSLAPVIYNLGIIAGIIVLAPRYGIYGAAIGVVTGSFLHFAVQAGAVARTGFRFRFLPDVRDPGVRMMARMMVPRTAGLAVTQVNLLILTGIATTVGAGSVAVFNLANNLQSFPVGVLGVSFAVASFPLIAELAAKGDIDRMRAEFSDTVRTVMFLVLPATVAFLLLRAQIVRVVLGTGAFDWNDTIDTADTLALFTLSLFAQALIPFVARTFFALKDVVTPLLAGVAAVATERFLAWYFLSRGMGTPGLALAFSVGASAQIALLWLVLRSRMGDLDERRIFSSVAVMCAAAALMGASMQGVKVVLGSMVDMRSFLGVFGQGAAAGLVGVAVYTGTALFLGSPEAHKVFAYARRRVGSAPDVVQAEDGGAAVE